MKRMMMGMAWLAGAALLAPSMASSQVGRVGLVQCRDGVPQGDLGISGLDCRGDCTLTMNEKGEEQSWSFTVEPRINGITRGGAADGLLEVGDLIVAIDGVPITTRDGGRRYANVDPGQEVEILVRREGRVESVTIVAGSVCPPPPPQPVPPRAQAAPRRVVSPDTVPPPPPRGITVGRLVAPPIPDTVAEPPRAIAVAPRIVVAPAARAAVSARAAPSPRGRITGGDTGLLRGDPPTGRIGIGFSCSHCGTRSDEETGENVWFFTGPVEVTSVTFGGPADEAGIQRGDLIRAIDGHNIESEEGGLAFTRIEGGEPVELSIVKRNGTESTVSLIPEERVVKGISALEATFSQRAPILRPERPAVPDPAPEPAPAAGTDAPEGMPLRYSSVVNGVEIEVRGNPVMVSELEGARTIYIRADGLWIKIVVPRRGLLLGTGSEGGGS